jgi:hypothetical protein
MSKLHETNIKGLFVFMCPGCNRVHQIWVYPKLINGFAWTFNGDVDKPTFSPSLLIHEGNVNPRCHSFIHNGDIEFLSDCTHDMAGKTVEIPEFDASRWE